MKKTLLFVGSVIILVFAAITFIFIPALAPSASGKAPVFGKYNGKAIELSQGSEFANAVANYTDSYRDYYRSQGRDLSEYDYFYIYNSAFNATVTTMAYRDAVEKSGWQPSDQEIARMLVKIPSLSENGKFSKRAYNALAESQKTSLKKDIANQLIWNRFRYDMFGATAADENGYATSLKLGDTPLFGLKSAANELDFLAAQSAEKRSFTMAAFNTADYPVSEIVAYGREHSDLFTRYDLSVITTDDEAEAKKLLAQFTSGELTFDADAVSAYSEKYYSGEDGKVTAAYKYQLKTAIPADADLESVLALKKDELSAVVKTSNGYSIYRADGEATAPVFEDEESDDSKKSDIVTTVQNYIKANESGLIEDYYLNIAKNFATSAVTRGFAKTCDEFGIEAIDVPAFALNYGNTSALGAMPSISQLGAASTNENFLKTVFSLKNGEVSEPLVLGNNVLVLKLVGEQTDTVSDDAKESLADSIATYDQNAAQTALMSSDKVENTVFEAFRKITTN